MSLTSDSILASAAPLFEEKGYHGTSMSDLAEACDLTKAALYHHFRDKESLFLALLERGLLCLETELAELESRADALDAKPLLTEIVKILANPPEEARLAMRLAGQDLTHLSQPVRDAFTADYRMRFPIRVGKLLAKTGLRPDVEPSFATMALMGLASSAQRRRPMPHDSPAKIADLFARGALANP